MDTNKHEVFCGEAALECGGLTPLSANETHPCAIWRHFGCLADRLFAGLPT
jgi:hypothetical protein